MDKRSHCSPYQGRASTRTLFLFVGILLIGNNVGHSFASWFMEGRSCWTELRDPTEIIMNNFITPYEKSPYDDSQVYIEVWEWDEKMNRVSDMVVLRDEQDDDDSIDSKNGKKIIYLHPDKGNVEEGDAADGSDEKFIRFHFLLKFIVTVEELKSYQYVMDAKPLPTKETSDDVDDDNVNGSSQGQKAQQHPMIPNFRSFKSGCQGLRGYGIHKENEIDEGLNFDILVPSSMFHSISENDDSDADVDADTGSGKDSKETALNSEYEVDVIAGWAIGRVVTLTKSISFRIAGRSGLPHHNNSSTSFDKLEDETITSFDKEL